MSKAFRPPAAFIKLKRMLSQKELPDLEDAARCIQDIPCLHHPNLLGEQLIHLACRHGQAQIVDLLADAGADLSALDMHQRTPLHMAAEWGSHETITRLCQRGVAVDVVDADGWTPLHWAAHNDHDECLRELVNSNATISCRTRKGRTPMAVGAAAGSAKAVMWLLRAGDDPGAVAINDQGWPLVASALDRMISESSNQPLVMTALMQVMSAGDERCAWAVERIARLRSSTR